MPVVKCRYAHRVIKHDKTTKPVNNQLLAGGKAIMTVLVYSSNSFHEIFHLWNVFHVCQLSVATPPHVLQQRRDFMITY